MKPVIFLPGMMCDARLFAPQVAALSAKHAPMLFPLIGADSVEGLARSILANAPPHFALAGLSMGGIVAMEVLRQAPERVERLALLDTNPRAEIDAVKALRGPQIEAAEDGRMLEVMEEQMFPKYLSASTPSAPILETCRHMAQALGPRVFVAQSRALRDRPAQLDTLADYKGKSLVLCGAEDVLCPLDRHTQMHELLENSVLEVIEGAGHLTTLEKPDAVSKALAAWLSQ